MNPFDFKDRTKKLGLEIIKLINKLPVGMVNAVIGKQILRSSLSVGANYRAACRAKSDKDFINKMKIVEEEIDETIYWLEIFEEASLLPKESLRGLLSESKEILAMVVASINTKLQKMRQQ